MYAAARSKVTSFAFLAFHDKLAAASKNWSRLAIYADRGVIVLNKPPHLVCQGSDVQDGQVGDIGWHATPLAKFKFIHRTRSPEREMWTSLMICCRVSAYRFVIELQ